MRHYKKKANDTNYTVETLASYPQNSQLKSKFNKIPKFHFVKWVIPEKIHTPPTEGMLENPIRGRV